ncbi:unnamed protein product [Brassicogethes aeneus]|uniref:DNA mismatch repair proteins mutS family domain-containing protein n=1 Tax=Brassicogethes aeneus TaxID=1431903 RepID=A0A9P0FE08_BRAAE|nr:unnamed protein product [Brassicogethes aeneus]
MASSEPAHALNLDIAQQQSFVRYFNTLPEKPPSTVRFFNRTDYYTLHGEDATFAGEYTSNPIKYMGSAPKLSYISLNKIQFEQFLRELLLVRQYRVEVFLKSSSSKNNDWYLEYKGSPGNLQQFEEILFENSTLTFSNSIMGIKTVRNRILAVASINMTEVKFEVCEIEDNECYSELEALIAQISPKECIIPLGDSPDLVSLKTVLERNGVLVAKVKKNDFNSEDVIQDLNRLLYFLEDQERNANTLQEVNLTEAIGSLGAVIRFLNLTGDEKNFNQFKISTLDIHRFVRLDNAALQALNVLPKAGSNFSDCAKLPSSSKSNCLVGILDFCVTTQGRRLLEQWVKQPLKDYNLINERLDIVECLVKDSESRSLLMKDCLTRMPDLMILSKKLSSKKANLQDCYRVYQAIGSIPSTVNILKNTENKCVIGTLVEPICDILLDLERYQTMIEQILDMDLVERGEFFVKKTFDDELNELYDKKQKIQEKFQSLLRKAAIELNFDEGKTIKLECNDQHGYFFRVTLKEEQALRDAKSYKIIDVVKGGVRFNNSKLVSLNEEYAEINEAYENQQKTVVAEIFEVARGYADTLRSLNMLIAKIDVYVSFATAAVSARIPYVRPKLHKQDAGVLKLKQARHPCLEQQEQVAFIPNDAEFDQNNKTLHIITGPNMCGKSTYIRSVGVCVLLAHIGSMVPCDMAEVSIVDAILARVGADDSQLKGLSTFMLEMIETSTIIKSATKNSLVIIDELGRGTSTYDGCGIAWSIAEFLGKDIKCFSLFATHFHEITRLANMYPSINNLHVTAVTTNDSITPLYQIKQGECDKSYGIHCARMVGFPNDVIEWALEHQTELEHQMGTKFITDKDPVEKRKVIEDGDKIIKEALKKVKSLDISTMTDDALKNMLQNMKKELQQKDNCFVNGLMSV